MDCGWLDERDIQRYAKLICLLLIQESWNLMDEEYSKNFKEFKLPEKTEEDSLSQDAAWPCDGFTQACSSFIFNPIGRQIYDLQGRVLCQHPSKMACTVTRHTVAAEIHEDSEIKRK